MQNTSKSQVAKAKHREADARWRAGISECFEILKNISLAKLDQRSKKINIRITKMTILNDAKEYIHKLEEFIHLLLQIKRGDPINEDNQAASKWNEFINKNSNDIGIIKDSMEEFDEYAGKFKDESGYYELEVIKQSKITEEFNTPKKSEVMLNGMETELIKLFPQRINHDIHDSPVSRSKLKLNKNRYGKSHSTTKFKCKRQLEREFLGFTKVSKNGTHTSSYNDDWTKEFLDEDANYNIQFDEPIPSEIYQTKVATLIDSEERVIKMDVDELCQGVPEIQFDSNETIDDSDSQTVPRNFTIEGEKSDSAMEVEDPHYIFNENTKTSIKFDKKESPNPVLASIHGQSLTPSTRTSLNSQQSSIFKSESEFDEVEIEFLTEDLQQVPLFSEISI